MKKIFLLSIILIFSIFCNPVFADIIPASSKNIKYYGIGVLNMPNNYTVYKYPSIDAQIKREVNYDNIKKSAIVNSLDMRKVSYIAHVPNSKIGLLTVDLDNGNNWYCVFLNQETGETGWVYNNNPEDFMTYKKLFDRYGKKYGIRMFSDLPKEKKVIYSKFNTNSKILAELTYPKYISFTLIKGNWMLVSARDISKQPKIGWFQWRNEDGTLNMFPNFND